MACAVWVPRDHFLTHGLLEIDRGACLEKSEGSVLNVRGCFLDCEDIPTGLFFLSPTFQKKVR